MADQDGAIVILDANGDEHEFPSGFDPKRAAAIVRAQMAKQPVADSSPAAAPSKSSDSASVAGMAASAALPKATQVAEELATNPAVPKMTGAAARTAVTLGGVVDGIRRGNISEVVAAPIAGWHAGRGGYWLGKNLQGVIAPVAEGMAAVAPYLKNANVVQGALDVTQMAEPERKDIGVLGVGGKADILGDPKAVERLIKASPSIGDAVSNLTQLGMSQTQAIAAVLTLKWKGHIPASNAEKSK